MENVPLFIKDVAIKENVQSAGHGDSEVIKTENGYVIKKFKGREDENYTIPESPYAIAGGLKGFYELFKKHLVADGVELANTNFVIGTQNESETDPSVYIIQQEVIGRQPLQEDNEYREISTVVGPQTLQKMKNDPSWTTLPKWIKDKYTRYDLDLLPCNVLVTTDEVTGKNKHVIIDW